MTSIISTKFNNCTCCVIDEPETEVFEKQDTDKIEEIHTKSTGTVIAFPNLTSRFGATTNVPKLLMSYEYETKNIETDLSKAISEEEQINNVLKANTISTTLDLQEANLFSSRANATAKTIDFVEYTGNSHTYNTKTNTSAIISCFQTDPNEDTAEQEKVFKGAVNVMVEWLDNYINNYEEKVAEGTANGEIEAKLSFLLRIRKAIENCSFPVGFAPQDGSAMGSYNWSHYINEFLNPENEAFTNRVAEHDLSPKMLLRTNFFIEERTFKTEAEAIAAIDNALATNNIDFEIRDLVFANENAYYQYKSVSLATTLIHEFVHSTHISNEAVTYFTCELMESDFYDKSVYTNYSSTFLQKAAQLQTKYGTLDLTNITYSDITTPVDTGENGIINAAFGHNLGSIDEIAEHGHEMNDGDDYTPMSSSNTKEECKKELLNFVYMA